MDIVGACLLDGFPTDNKLSLKTSKSAAKGVCSDGVHTRSKL